MYAININHVFILLFFKADKSFYFRGILTPEIEKHEPKFPSKHAYKVDITDLCTSKPLVTESVQSETDKTQTDNKSNDNIDVSTEGANIENSNSHTEDTGNEEREKTLPITNNLHSETTASKSWVDMAEESLDVDKLPDINFNDSPEKSVKPSRHKLTPEEKQKMKAERKANRQKHKVVAVSHDDECFD